MLKPLLGFSKALNELTPSTLVNNLSILAKYKANQVVKEEGKEE